jgi:hypothetical protein
MDLNVERNDGSREGDGWRWLASKVATDVREVAFRSPGLITPFDAFQAL